MYKAPCPQLIEIDYLPENLRIISHVDEFASYFSHVCHRNITMFRCIVQNLIPNDARSTIFPKS
jgi:hypothetical protein